MRTRWAFTTSPAGQRTRSFPDDHLRAQPRRPLAGDEATREAQRIRAVDDWPRGPLLHLKRYLGEYDLEFGLICAPDLRNAARSIRIFAEPTSAGPSDEVAVVASYATVEDLVDDGWMID
jgi:hypothetical protein